MYGDRSFCYTIEENQLLSKIDELISSKLSDFKKRMEMSQKEISQEQLSKIPENLNDGHAFNFRRKGNEEQFKVNSQVMSRMKEADGYLQEVLKQSPSETALNAQKKISEGISILSHRQKLSWVCKLYTSTRRIR